MLLLNNTFIADQKNGENYLDWVWANSHKDYYLCRDCEEKSQGVFDF